MKCQTAVIINIDVLMLFFFFRYSRCVEPDNEGERQYGERKIESDQFQVCSHFHNVNGEPCYEKPADLFFYACYFTIGVVWFAVLEV